jgi:hypothetical protein
MTTRLPPISNQELKRLYAECVALGQVAAVSEWTPPPTTAQELIDRIRKGKP